MSSEHPPLRPLDSALCSPARQTDLARPALLTPAGSSPPIRREIRRFAASISACRDTLAGRRAGRFVSLWKERHRSFRIEDPKGRNRKERCSSGVRDPARPTADRVNRFPTRPANPRFKSFYSGARNFVSSALYPDPVTV